MELMGWERQTGKIRDGQTHCFVFLMGFIENKNLNNSSLEQVLWCIQEQTSSICQNMFEVDFFLQSNQRCFILICGDFKCQCRCFKDKTLPHSAPAVCDGKDINSTSSSLTFAPRLSIDKIQWFSTCMESGCGNHGAFRGLSPTSLPAHIWQSNLHSNIAC